MMGVLCRGGTLEGRMAGDLDDLLKIISGPGRLLIVTHDNPDPDALVSASALAKLAEVKADVRSRICCEGIVGRAENRALARELRLKLMSASRVNWRKWPKIALVDTQPGAGNNSLPRRRTADLVIDHHPLRRRTKAKFVDVRPEHGACATLIAEYLEAAAVSVSSDLAAALCYAISSETQDLSREASPADVAAYMRLYPLADKRMLSGILHPRLKHDYFSTLTRAVLGAFTYGNIIGSHLGDVSHPDSISLVADLLLRHERMGWSMVTGTWKDALYVSLRTVHGQAHAGRMLQRVLGTRGRAGGHGTMAGGRATLVGLDEGGREELSEDLVKRLIRILKRRTDVVLKPLIGPEEIGACCKPANRSV